MLNSEKNGLNAIKQTNMNIKGEQTNRIFMDVKRNGDYSITFENRTEIIALMIYYFMAWLRRENAALPT
jgi:hypothetical protein